MTATLTLRSIRARGVLVPMPWPLQIKAGQAIIPERPGSGVEWNEDAVRHHLAAS